MFNVQWQEEEWCKNDDWGWLCSPAVLKQPFTNITIVVFLQLDSAFTKDNQQRWKWFTLALPAKKPRQIKRLLRKIHTILKKKQELTLVLETNWWPFRWLFSKLPRHDPVFHREQISILVSRCHEGRTDCHLACLMVDCDCATKKESGTNQSDRHACLRHADDWSDTKEMGYLRQDLLSLSSYINPVHISNPAIGMILWPLLCNWVRILANIYLKRKAQRSQLTNKEAISLSLSASFSSELFMSL